MEKSQTDSSSQQQQQNQQSLRNEGIKLPELPQHNAQNIQFSKKSTEHAKKPENRAHSQTGKKKGFDGNHPWGNLDIGNTIQRC